MHLNAQCTKNIKLHFDKFSFIFYLQSYPGLILIFSQESSNRVYIPVIINFTILCFKPNKIKNKFIPKIKTIAYCEPLFYSFFVNLKATLAIITAIEDYYKEFASEIIYNVNNVNELEHKFKEGRNFFYSVPKTYQSKYNHNRSTTMLK